MGSLEPVYYFENIYGLKIGPSLRKIIYGILKCTTGLDVKSGLKLPLLEQILLRVPMEVRGFMEGVVKG